MAILITSDPLVYRCAAELSGGYSRVRHVVPPHRGPLGDELDQPWVDSQGAAHDHLDPGVAIAGGGGLRCDTLHEHTRVQEIRDGQDATRAEMNAPVDTFGNTRRRKADETALDDASSAPLPEQAAHFEELGIGFGVRRAASDQEHGGASGIGLWHLSLDLRDALLGGIEERAFASQGRGRVDLDGGVAGASERDLPWDVPATMSGQVEESR